MADAQPLLSRSHIQIHRDEATPERLALLASQNINATVVGGFISVSNESPATQIVFLTEHMHDPIEPPLERLLFLTKKTCDPWHVGESPILWPTDTPEHFKGDRGVQRLYRQR